MKGLGEGGGNNAQDRKIRYLTQMPQKDESDLSDTNREDGVTVLEGEEERWPQASEVVHVLSACFRNPDATHRYTDYSAFRNG